MHTDSDSSCKVLLVPGGRQHEQAQANFREHRGPFPLHIYEHPQKSYTQFTDFLHTETFTASNGVKASNCYLYCSKNLTFSFRKEVKFTID